jgi:hypothetical protein
VKSGQRAFFDEFTVPLEREIMKKLLVGDRLGGVLFDVQQFRSNMMRQHLRFDMRERLIACIAYLCELVEQIDESKLHPNPRIEPPTGQEQIDESKLHPNPRIEPPTGQTVLCDFHEEQVKECGVCEPCCNDPRLGFHTHDCPTQNPFTPCLNPTHDRYSTRKSDCSECKAIDAMDAAAFRTQQRLGSVIGNDSVDTSCICKENDGRKGAPLCPVHDDGTEDDNLWGMK